MKNEEQRCINVNPAGSCRGCPYAYNPDWYDSGCTLPYPFGKKEDEERKQSAKQKENNKN